MKPIWMSDPTISDISEEKLSFLSEMFENVKGKNKNELMPFLMAMAKNKKKNISFTSDEMNRIITAIKKAATNEERQQIEKMMQMAQNKILNNAKTDQ